MAAAGTQLGPAQWGAAAHAACNGTPGRGTTLEEVALVTDTIRLEARECGVDPDAALAASLTQWRHPHMSVVSTALHGAAACDSTPRAEVLQHVLSCLPAGANINAITNDQGLTPLHLAATRLRRHAAPTLALLRAGANPLQPAIAGDVPLHAACTHDSRVGAPVVCAMLACRPAGSNVDARDYDRATPLQVAVEFLGGDPEAAAIKALLAHGADPRANDRYGVSALSAARGPDRAGALAVIMRHLKRPWTMDDVPEAFLAPGRIWRADMVTAMWATKAFRPRSDATPMEAGASAEAAAGNNSDGDAQMVSSVAHAGAGVAPASDTPSDDSDHGSWASPRSSVDSTAGAGDADMESGSVSAAVPSLSAAGTLLGTLSELAPAPGDHVSRRVRHWQKMPRNVVAEVLELLVGTSPAHWAAVLPPP